MTKRLAFLLFCFLLPLSSSAKTAYPNSLAPMLAKISPSVVNITVMGKVPAQINVTNPSDGHSMTIPTEKMFNAVGSGVIIDATKGYVLTNAHVINRANSINIVLNDGRKLKAKPVGIDPPTDIAVVQIPAHHLTQIPIGDDNNLRVGDFVTTIGNPFGLHQSVTSGVISALHRDDLHIEAYEDFIQTDAPINPGNSGGALVDQQGHLVGINTAIFSGTERAGNIGIGFAIPINMAMAAANQLIQHGRINRGLLGIMIQKVTPALADTMGLPNTNGALVSDVLPSSPADQAGIQPQDVIQTIADKPIRTSSQLRNTTGMMPIGTKVKLSLWRNGTTLHKRITIGNPNNITEPESNNLLFGVQLRRIEGINVHGKTIQGVGADIVEPNSLAWMNGLRPGDVILSINQTPISTIDQVNQIAKRNHKHMLLKVYRRNGMYFIAIENNS